MSAATFSFEDIEHGVNFAGFARHRRKFRSTKPPSVVEEKSAPVTEKSIPSEVDVNIGKVSLQKKRKSSSSQEPDRAPKRTKEPEYPESKFQFDSSCLAGLDDKKMVACFASKIMKHEICQIRRTFIDDHEFISRKLHKACAKVARELPLFTEGVIDREEKKRLDELAKLADEGKIQPNPKNAELHAEEARIDNLIAKFQEEMSSWEELVSEMAHGSSVTTIAPTAASTFALPGRTNLDCTQVIREVDETTSKLMVEILKINSVLSSSSSMVEASRQAQRAAVEATKVQMACKLAPPAASPKALVKSLISGF